jgi:hypothetical protein
VTLKNVLIV